MSFSDDVRVRFDEISPVRELSEMDVLEVERECKVAFEIVGYLPKNFNDAFQKAWESSDATMLSEFIYNVWEEDLWMWIFGYKV